MEKRTARPKVIVARGAIAAEARLLAEVDELVAEAVDRPAALGRPVVVVVPSRTLRQHLQAALVARHGRAVAGVVVTTLRALALEIVERCRMARPRGATVLPVLVARAARREETLAERLGDFDDGFETLGGTVRDLLDAGFVPALAEALDERLADLERRDGPVAVRGRAILRVAAEVAAEIERFGIGRTSTLFAAANEALRADPAAALPARAVLVHGFADATGVATDLLEALVIACAARVIVDEPPDAVDPDVADVGAAFLVPLRERLGGAGGSGPDTAPRVIAGLRFATAPGISAEVREVARRIRELLDAGVTPERIGVVARNLEPYRLPAMRAFARRAVPFTTLGRAGLAAAGRRPVQALEQLVRLGPRTAVATWLAAHAPEPGAVDDLRIGLWACGAARLADVAALRVEHVLGPDGELALPLRSGIDEAGEGRGGALLRRRRLSGRSLRQAVAAAGRLCGFFDDRSRGGPCPVAAHVATLVAALGAHLGWRDVDPLGQELVAALAGLERDAPPDFAITWAEFVPLLTAALAGVGGAPLGGDGGGVRLLDVTGARAMTFDHLFLVGLNRGVFPRQVSEDPLLPDGVRRALQDVLPDLPLKGRGHEEERYLFAQAIAACRNVTLSWLAADDDGKPMTPSPLVERLRIDLELRAEDVHRVPDAWAPPVGGGGALRPADEHAVLAGLYGSRAEAAAALAVALTPPVAAARAAVLEELDEPRGAALLGPYLGLVGPKGAIADPRAADPHVTTLEALAGCPWQTFLTRVLRLEPVADPEGALVGFDRAIVGTVVHRVLEAVACGDGDRVETLDAARAAVPRRVTWPDGPAIGDLVREVSARVAAEAGLPLPGVAQAVAALAGAHLARAREVDEAGAARALGVVGVELSGAALVEDAAGIQRRVGFRADRAEATGGGLRLTDFKTGNPDSDASGGDTRRAHLLREIAAGRRLQAAAYAFGAGGAGDVGRYLFLGERAREDTREVEVAAGDAAARDAFAAAVRTLLAAWDQGAFPPRVYEKDLRTTPRRCAWCRVREACPRLDSGQTTRIARWVRAAVAAGDEGGLDQVDAALAVWLLGGAPAGAAAAEGE